MAKHSNVAWARKTIYSLVSLVLWVSLIIQVYWCVEKYIEEPTYYETDIKRQKESEFPEITLCPYLDKLVCRAPEEKQVLGKIEFKYLECGLRGKLGEDWHKKLSCRFLIDLKTKFEHEFLSQHLYPHGWEDHFPLDWKQNPTQLPPCTGDFQDNENEDFVQCEKEEGYLNGTWGDMVHGMSSYNLTEFVSQITITSKSDNTERVILSDNGGNESLATFKEQRSTEFGKCYTMIFSKEIRKEEISKVNIWKT